MGLAVGELENVSYRESDRGEDKAMIMYGNQNDRFVFNLSGINYFGPVLVASFFRLRKSLQLGQIRKLSGIFWVRFPSSVIRWLKCSRTKNAVRYQKLM